MSTAIRVQKDVREQAAIVADGMGVSLSELVTDFLVDISKKQKAPEEKWRLKPEVEKELLEMREENKRGIGLSPKFNSLEESFEWLNS